MTPSYERCRRCHHYEASSIHREPRTWRYHAFDAALPGEIPDGWKDPGTWA